MGLKRQTKRHQNNTPICFAHLDKCNGIVLACWRSTLPVYGARKSPVFFTPSCEPASCRLLLPLLQLRWVPTPRRTALLVPYVTGRSTSHLGLGLWLGFSLCSSSWCAVRWSASCWRAARSSSACALRTSSSCFLAASAAAHMAISAAFSAAAHPSMRSVARRAASLQRAASFSAARLASTAASRST